MHSDSPLVAGGDDYFGGQVAEYCGEFIDSDHNDDPEARQSGSASPPHDVLAGPAELEHRDVLLQRRLLLLRRRVEGLPARPRHAPVAGSSRPATRRCGTASHAGRLRRSTSSPSHDWIDQYVPGGHQSNFGRLLDSAYNEEYGADTTDQSSLNLVFLLGFKSKPGNFQIFGASDERFHIAGGNQQLPRDDGLVPHRNRADHDRDRLADEHDRPEQQRHREPLVRRLEDARSSSTR